ncbi:MAG: DUF4326 domain-containing protein [Burkholderiaceae bacterium]
MSSPTRIQLRRTKGWRMPENTVKVDRSTRWGNPFTPTMLLVSPSRAGMKQGEPIGVAGAVEAFRTLMKTRLRREPAKTRAFLEELRGKNLACWCQPGTPCHADVLLKLANQAPAPSP